MNVDMNKELNEQIKQYGPQSSLFVTGTYGAGKTTFTEAYSKMWGIPLQVLDNTFVIRGPEGADKREYAEKYLKTLPETFVMDGVPWWNKNGGTPDFQVSIDFMGQPGSGVTSKMIVCICSDMSHYFQRLLKTKPHIYPMILDCESGLADNEQIAWIASTIANRNDLALTHLITSCTLYLQQFTDSGIDFDIYDTFSNKFIDKNEYDKYVEYVAELRKRKGDKFMTREEFKKYFWAIGSKYDFQYQDIEYIDYVGYSHCHTGWENLKDLIDWKGISVVDLAGHHGYYAIKIKQAGARRSATYDFVQAVVDTNNILNDSIGNPIEVGYWESKEPIPQGFDVALLLNCLHHMPDPELTVKNLTAYGRVIFEVNLPQQELIEKYFNVIKTKVSHHAPADINRVILLCIPK